MEENIIKRLGLTEMEVVNIVSEWYQNGMHKGILQDENGNELCEITQDTYDSLNNDG